MKDLSRDKILGMIPPEGFFRGKEWLLSPEPFKLERAVFDHLKILGGTLTGFLSACDGLYLESVRGQLACWVSDLLNLGKPSEVIDAGIHPSVEGEFARVIRPDVLLTEQGLKLSEIDATPGGIGLTAWLNQVYAGEGWAVVGGAQGMINAFGSILDKGRVVFSREALDYRPEIEWIVGQINPNWRESELIFNEWEFEEARHSSENFYRYFELWDLKNISNIHVFKRLADSGKAQFTAPMKAFLEEKLWLALLWVPGLRTEWLRRLGKDDFKRMREVVPQGWILDPAPIPLHSEYPGLDIQNWSQLHSFSQRERELVIKISGFSEKAWGSRGVTIGHDINAADWKSAIDGALAGYNENPRIMQRFSQPKVVSHPYYHPESGEIRVMEGRVRLCPYYFRIGSTVELAGILATICPKEKKIIHGMRDAILVPCIVG
jgi:hypothetical protein